MATKRFFFARSVRRDKRSAGKLVLQVSGPQPGLRQILWEPFGNISSLRKNSCGRRFNTTVLHNASLDMGLVPRMASLDRPVLWSDFMQALTD